MSITGTLSGGNRTATGAGSLRGSADTTITTSKAKTHPFAIRCRERPPSGDVPGALGHDPLMRRHEEIAPEHQRTDHLVLLPGRNHAAQHAGNLRLIALMGTRSDTQELGRKIAAGQNCLEILGGGHR